MNVNDRNWMLGQLSLDADGKPLWQPTHESRWLWRLVDLLDADRQEGHILRLTRTDERIIIDILPEIGSKVAFGFMIQQRTGELPPGATIINLEEENVKAQAKSATNGRMLMMREVQA